MNLTDKACETAATGHPKTFVCKENIDFVRDMVVQSESLWNS